jgi:hypothetical protein
MVHPEGSVLGPISRDDGSTRPGIKRSYKRLIQQVFKGKYWGSNLLFDAQQNEIGQGTPANTNTR